MKTEMKAEKRRELILALLKNRNEPVSASALAEQFQVSRQIIVGDIALLRALGESISATPRGYIYTGTEKKGSDGLIRQIAVCHTREQTERELQIIVDNGCTVLDVIIEHPVYGQLIGSLMLSSRYDVRQFLEKSREESVHPLSELTDGIHLHTLRCPGIEAYERVIRELREFGILIN